MNLQIYIGFLFCIFMLFAYLKQPLMNFPNDANATNSSILRSRRDDQLLFNYTNITTPSEVLLLTTTREHIKKPAVADASQLEQSRKTKQPIPNNNDNPQPTTSDYLVQLQKDKDDALEKFNKCKLSLNQTCNFIVNNCIDAHLKVPSNFSSINNIQSNSKYDCSFQYQYYETFSNSVNNRTSSFFEELRKTKSECNDLALLEYSLINNDTLNNLNVSNSCFNLSVIEGLRIYEKQSILKCTLRSTLQTLNSNEKGLIKECDVTAYVCEKNNDECKRQYDEEIEKLTRTTIISTTSIRSSISSTEIATSLPATTITTETTTTTMTPSTISTTTISTSTTATTIPVTIFTSFPFSTIISSKNETIDVYTKLKGINLQKLAEFYSKINNFQLFYFLIALFYLMLTIFYSVLIIPILKHIIICFISAIFFVISFFYDFICKKCGSSSKKRLNSNGNGHIKHRFKKLNTNPSSDQIDLIEENHGIINPEIEQDQEINLSETEIILSFPKDKPAWIFLTMLFVYGCFMSNFLIFMNNYLITQLSHNYFYQIELITKSFFITFILIRIFTLLSKKYKLGKNLLGFLRLSWCLKAKKPKHFIIFFLAFKLLILSLTQLYFVITNEQTSEKTMGLNWHSKLMHSFGYPALLSMLVPYVFDHLNDDKKSTNRHFISLLVFQVVPFSLLGFILHTILTVNFFNSLQNFFVYSNLLNSSFLCLLAITYSCCVYVKNKKNFKTFTDFKFSKTNKRTSILNSRNSANINKNLAYLDSNSDDEETVYLNH